jgi:Ca2+-binding RTX toxin-like protein
MSFTDTRVRGAGSRAWRDRRAVHEHLARLSLLAAASVAMVGVVAGPGHAATSPTAFVANGTDVHYFGNDIANRVLATSDFAGAVLLEEPLNGISPGPGCKAVTTTKVRCLPAAGPAKRIFLHLAGGGDQVKVQTSIFTHIEGGSGSDVYLGATSSTGTNVFFNGGEGTDRADYSFSTSRVLVSLGTNAGDRAEDGRPGKGNDNIDRTVEDLLGSDHDDSLRGNESDNSITGGLGADALRGGPGNDNIFASESNVEGSEADKPDLSCGSGHDEIIVDFVDPTTSECEVVDRRP